MTEPEEMTTAVNSLSLTPTLRKSPNAVNGTRKRSALAILQQRFPSCFEPLKAVAN
jgi:hypothetical protein